MRRARHHATPTCSPTSSDSAPTLVEPGSPTSSSTSLRARDRRRRGRDPTRTPAQRVRAGFDAIRRGAGDDDVPPRAAVRRSARASAWSTACASAPTSRRGGSRAELGRSAGYDDVAPGDRSTPGATRSPVSSMHRRLWLNDPDCLMLRTDETELTPAQSRAWACRRRQRAAWRWSPTTSPCSTDRPDASARRGDRIGRRVDSAALSGSPAQCADLMSRRPRPL